MPETKIPSGDMWKESKFSGKVQIWAWAEAVAVAKVKALAVRSAVEISFFIAGSESRRNVFECLGGTDWRPAGRGTERGEHNGRCRHYTAPENLGAKVSLGKPLGRMDS